jgi:membrane-anchored protein YejM (alkaline phosphatase superfamily)
MQPLWLANGILGKVKAFIQTNVDSIIFAECWAVHTTISRLNPKAHSIEKNGDPVISFSNDYLTDYFTDEGLQWIEKQHESDTPWFLFMSYNAPHGPLQATKADIAQFNHIKDPKRRIYAAMMFSLDRSVGRLTEWLERT